MSQLPSIKWYLPKDEESYEPDSPIIDDQEIKETQKHFLEESNEDVRKKLKPNFTSISDTYDNDERSPNVGKSHSEPVNLGKKRKGDLSSTEVKENSNDLGMQHLSKSSSKSVSSEEFVPKQKLKMQEDSSNSYNFRKRTQVDYKKEKIEKNTAQKKKKSASDQLKKCQKRGRKKNGYSKTKLNHSTSDLNSQSEDEKAKIRLPKKIGRKKKFTARVSSNSEFEGFSSSKEPKSCGKKINSSNLKYYKQTENCEPTCSKADPNTSKSIDQSAKTLTLVNKNSSEIKRSENFDSKTSSKLNYDRKMDTNNDFSFLNYKIYNTKDFLTSISGPNFSSERNCTKSDVLSESDMFKDETNSKMYEDGEGSLPSVNLNMDKVVAECEAFSLALQKELMSSPSEIILPNEPTSSIIKTDLLVKNEDSENTKQQPKVDTSVFEIVKNIKTMVVKSQKEYMDEETRDKHPITMQDFIW